MVTLAGTKLVGCKQGRVALCVQPRNSVVGTRFANRRQVAIVAAAKKAKKAEEEPELPPLNNDKIRRAQDVILGINKQYGEGTAMAYGTAPPEVERLSTGDPYLDWALSGGYARGRIVEIYGPPSAGKSTMCLAAVAEAQRRGELSAYIDVENSFDPYYAQKLGVDIQELVLINGPDCGETALNIVEKLTLEGCGMIVVDSVSALVPKVELTGKIEDVQPGLQARMMSKALRTITPYVNKGKTVLIFVNQLRNKIGVMYGNPEITSGGAALSYYASQRIDCRALKGDVIHPPKATTKDTPLGQRIRCRIVKNKVGFPQREAYVHHYFNRGLDRTASLVDAGIKLDIIKKSGSWLVFGSIKTLGTDKFVDKVKEAPEIELGLIKALQDMYHESEMVQESEVEEKSLEKVEEEVEQQV
eukprot:TRINITY_DN1227_c0_g1_i1.p1 TRINITY_DN1227_c0_g1~~TRINITY_DN1227_c0_g1_i1.p1  ORF type:complete len:444 (-),score=84.27 TRINITY_DN1227_c0_g1_i1:1248-2495(-)